MVRMKGALLMARGLAGIRCLATAIEWLLLALAASLLLLPDHSPLLGLATIGGSLAVRRLATGRWIALSRMNAPLVLLALALLMSLVPSVRPERSLEMFCQIVLGMAIVWTCLATCRSSTAIQLATLLFLGLGTTIAIVGLVGMAEPPAKLFEEPDLRLLLPPALGPLEVTLGVDRSFNSNDVGGTVVLFAPLALTLIWVRNWIRIIAIPTAVVLLAVLILTQSRSALIGTVIALVVGAVWAVEKRRVCFLSIVVITSLAGVLTIMTFDNFSIWSRISAVISQVVFGEAGSGRSVSLAGRVELWMPALAMIVDMPFSGIGLNTFPVVLQEFYPTKYYDPVYSPFISNAHSIFLQTALDLGLVGLGACLWLSILAVRGGRAAARRGIERPLAIGLTLGLLAHGVYGLMNAGTLAGRPSIALWSLLGLLGALGEMESMVTTGKEGQGVASWQPASKGWRSHRSWVQSAIGGGLILVASSILVAPVALNFSRVVLQRSGAAPFREESFVLSFVQANLALATRLGWGPYTARALAARSLLARLRGDTDTQLTTLQAAVAAAPWDPSLTHQLGVLYLARGEWRRAAEVWGEAKAGEFFIRIGKAVAPPEGLEWYSRAQAVDPTDWRPYVAATEELLDAQRFHEAGVVLAKGLSTVEWKDVASDENADAARRALAERLVDSTTPLPAHAPVSISVANGELFANAARVLESRSDVAGALYAAQLASHADPSSVVYRTRLESLRQRLAEHGLAQGAQRSTMLGP